MASADRPHRPASILRRWSRRPTLCKLFSKAKTSFRCKLAIAKLLRQASSSSSSPTSSSASTPPPASAAPPPDPPSLPHSQGQLNSMQRCTSLSSHIQSAGVLVGAIAIANCLRRHSDAIAPPGLRANSLQHRFSLDSLRYPYFTTTDMNDDEHTLPDVVRLGSSKANLRSLRTYNTSDLLAMGSPIVSKVKDTCAHLGHVAAGRRSSSVGGHHPLDLFIGNPFLTRVNPAPVSPILPNSDHLVTPSSGLLNASIKARDCELKDRIVFFA